MKTFLLLIAALALGSAAFAHPSCIATITLRWQEPAAAEDAVTAPAVGVTARELHKAVRRLNRAVYCHGIDIHLGTYPAAHPSTDPNALGRLWINGVPLENLVTVTHNAGAVSAEQLVRVGMTASQQLLAAAKTHPKQKPGSHGQMSTTAEPGTRPATGSGKTILSQ